MKIEMYGDLGLKLRIIGSIHLEIPLDFTQVGIVYWLLVFTAFNAIMEASILILHWVIIIALLLA